jgi:hypothetical protein
MGEVLGLGISHYPLFSATDRDMAMILADRLTDTGIAQELKDPANWPEAMRREWSNDGGEKEAARHRDAMLIGLRRARAALDAFKPDFCVIWGDDQYENFHEDVVPAFCVFAYEDMDVAPWRQAHASALVGGKPNVWNESADTTFRIKGAREGGKWLASRLLESNFDVAYAYKNLHHAGLPHAFLNSVLYLDYDRTGFPYPIVPLQINCYGRLVISHKGYGSHFSAPTVPLDPPSPSPTRCFDLGAAVARACAAGPYRVALIASSSWSHAFLVDKTWRMQPDLPSDRRLYEAMVAGDYDTWRNVSLEQLEQSGQQEMLNWFALMGAMNALGRSLTWSDIVETYIFNSTKVAAIFDPVPVGVS